MPAPTALAPRRLEEAWWCFWGEIKDFLPKRLGLPLAAPKEAPKEEWLASPKASY